MALSWGCALADNLQNILLVCGGNTGRSPMAESLANDYFHFSVDGYRAFSRGIHANPQQTMPEENAVIVMQQWKSTTEIEKHRALPVTAEDIHVAAMVLTMTAAQKETLQLLYPSAAHKIWMLSQCATGLSQDVHDMYGHDLAFYQQTSQQIAHYLQLIQAHRFKCYQNPAQ